MAVIDHWVNYRYRFIREGEIVLPDEVWVSDEDAFDEARRSLPMIPARILPNMHLEGLLREIAAWRPAPPREEPRNILYVLEPIRQPWGHDERPGELQAFQYFVDSLTAMGVGADTNITLRPHPSDASGKYDEWPRLFGSVRLTIDAATSLSQQIAEADWVVGCESFALVVALNANRIVISSLPPWAPPCRLPQRGLRHLRSILNSAV